MFSGLGGASEKKVKFSIFRKFLVGGAKKGGVQGGQKVPVFGRFLGVFGVDFGVNNCRDFGATFLGRFGGSPRGKLGIFWVSGGSKMVIFCNRIFDDFWGSILGNFWGVFWVRTRIFSVFFLFLLWVGH